MCVSVQRCYDFFIRLATISQVIKMLKSGKPVRPTGRFLSKTTTRYNRSPVSFILKALWGILLGGRGSGSLDRAREESRSATAPCEGLRHGAVQEITIMNMCQCNSGRMYSSFGAPWRPVVYHQESSLFLLCPVMNLVSQDGVGSTGG